VIDSSKLNQFGVLQEGFGFAAHNIPLHIPFIMVSST